VIHRAVPVARPLPRTGSLGRLLVVDDDRRAASARAEWLCGLGWHASAVGRPDEALAAIAREPFDACLIDGLLPDGTAPRIAAAARGAAATTGIVVTLPESAAAPAPAWADRVVRLPARDDALLAAIAEAIAIRAAAASPPAWSLLGDSPAIRRVRDLALRLADAPAAVLVTGESGTGKSLLARDIHRVSRRRRGRFVEVACGSLSESLLESELFGHVAGAFTGATGDREGKFLQADGGTIFLDEIATASPALQVKLLRVLQDMRFEPVGGTRTHAVDARVILATNEDLAARVAAGTFRGDLFWRVNVLTIEMPPLRERAEDVPLLAAHFLAAFRGRGGRVVEGFAPEAVAALSRHDWPGNVRELAHAVEFAAALGSGPLITTADLPPTVRDDVRTAAADVTAGALKRALEHPERRLILEALRSSGGRRDAAARALGINRTTLYKKLKRLGISLADLAESR
jgi:DNA-binding NtrC family response regulator